MNSKKISIYLHEGLPRGVRYAGIDQWSGRAIAGPRNDLNGILSLLAEYNYNGSSLYFLIGQQNKTDLPLIYIGETNKFKDRIKQHNRNKPWWEDVVIFFSSDGSFTTTGSKYLESTCIERIGKMGYSVLDNNTKPSVRQVALEDRGGLEEFYKNVIMLLPLLGHNIVVNEGEEEKNEEEIFFCKRKGIDARGVMRKDGKIKVLKGSTAVKEITSSFSGHTYKKLRDDLIAIGKLQKTDNNYILSDDYIFSSPSAAGAVLLGNSTNGRIEWRNHDGKTLKEIELQSTL